MPGRDLDTITAPRTPTAAAPTTLSQMTAVEQARAVAEVQAAVFVAQQVPRNVDRVLADMKDATGRMVLAKQAFYSVRNRGSGPSIHLMRELARIWGNIAHGVRELHRDDEAGMSEVLAYAWDQQANTRSERSFIVPHAHMVKPDPHSAAVRQPLTDLGDIYRNNQNVGARALRECISSVLPGWFRQEAEQRCRHTLNAGEEGGETLQQRVAGMIKAFAALGVGVDRLEARLGVRKGAWDGSHVADMIVAYESIQRGETSKDDEFPQRRVTAEQVHEQNHSYAPPPAAPESADPDWPETAQPGTAQPDGTKP